MDFTYIVALCLSVLIGFASAVLFVAFRGRSYWRLAIPALLVAVAADFALLLDWSRANEFPASLLLADAVFFVGYGLIGCFIGALPVVGARAAYRRFKARRVN